MFETQVNSALKTVMLGTVIGALLVGCGQKGNLYMPEQANSNVDFIIYKNNKVDPQQQQDTETIADDAIDGQDILITDDPNDY